MPSLSERYVAARWPAKHRPDCGAYSETVCVCDYTLQPTHLDPLVNEVLDAAEKWEMERSGGLPDYPENRIALSHAVDALDNALREVEQ